MTTPKWTEERTEQLMNSVGADRPVSRDTVEEIAATLETSSRSVSAKLRKLGVDVEKATATPKVFSDEVTEELRQFVTDHSGQYTYAEIAENFPGDYATKSIMGKLLSMELTDHVKETPKTEVPKTFTPEQEATVISMANAGAFMEDIAAAVNKPIQSVRGKSLSLFSHGDITSIPKMREVKGAGEDPLAALGDVSGLTVVQIAEKIGKTERGVKNMLTRRGIKASDYDGAGKKAKEAENA